MFFFLLENYQTQSLTLKKNQLDVICPEKPYWIKLAMESKLCARGMGGVSIEGKQILVTMDMHWIEWI